MRVGIIGSAERDEVIRLSIRLSERSAEAVILDSRQDPRIRMTQERTMACGEELDDLAGIYVADLGLPSPVKRGEGGTLDPEASARALSASRRRLSAWNALLSRMALRCPVVNPIHTHDLHYLKPWEMAVYHRMKLPIPVTLATSDPSALTDLPGDPEHGWIRKGMVGGYGYTEKFSPPATLKEAEDRLRQGPMMVQERIAGENLRIFVLNGEAIGAAEVIPQNKEESDSRRGEIRIQRVKIPVETKEAALAAAGRWGLLFAAVDMIFDPGTKGHLVLECNSSPFFAAFERKTGLPVSSRLADFFVGQGP